MVELSLITIGAPVIKLNSTITNLNENVEGLDRRIGILEVTNADGHKRIWERVTKQQDTLNAYESRIYKLECKGSSNELK